MCYYQGWKILNTLLDGFDGKLTSSKWAKMNTCSKDTALRDIQDLINKNILQKEAKGGRSTNYELNYFFNSPFIIYLSTLCNPSFVSSY